MAKTNNLLLVLNLLHYRRRVTTEDIMRTCKVSARTAYRYITTLSESNIPIYFDKDTGGYRLNIFSKVTADHVTILDSILLKVALRLLEKSTDGAYSEAIETLARKLDSVLIVPDDDVLGVADRYMALKPKPADVVRLIHELILQTAVQEDRVVRLRVAGHPAHAPATTIRNPSLTFKGGWQITSRDPDNEGAISLSDIDEVQLVEQGHPE